MPPDQIDTGLNTRPPRLRLSEFSTKILGAIAVASALSANLSYIVLNLGRVVLAVGFVAVLGLLLWSIAVLHVPARFPAPPRIRRLANLSYAIALIIAGAMVIPTRDVVANLVSTSEDEAEYFLAYVSVEGDEAACTRGDCLLRYKVTGLFRAGDGRKAVYVDRVKTSGRIESLVTIPNHIVRNPAQYPANPTYLEFAIPSEASVLEPRVDLVLRKAITKDRGKIGFHLPYRTAGAAIMVDLSRLGFAPAGQITAFAEVLRSDGVSDAGYDLALKPFQNGKFLMTTARNLAARTSIVVQWGD